MAEEHWEINEIWPKTNKWDGVRELTPGGQGHVYVVRGVTARKRREDAARVVEQFRLEHFGMNRPPGTTAADEATRVARAFKELLAEPEDLGVLKRYFIRRGSDKKQTQARFMREVETLEALRAEPAVLRLLGKDRKEWAGPDWMVTEFHPAGSLDSRDAAGAWSYRSRFTGNVRQTLEALRPIIALVAKMHSMKPPLVHRDIKPGNIFIAADGRLALGDFGIVFVSEPGATRLSRFDEVAGPWDFMPPWRNIEDLRSDQVLPHDDVYMLGKVLWWMLTSGPINREWHDRREFDLVELFPDEPWMRGINEILQSCVVDDEAKCRLRDAGALLEVVDARLGALSNDGEYLDSSALRPCRICGRGHYRPALEEESAVSAQARLLPVPQARQLEPRVSEGVTLAQLIGVFHPSNAGSMAVFAYSCDRCGHVEFFRGEWHGNADNLARLAAWRHVPQ